MIKIGIIEMVALFVLFMILAYIGVSMKGILIVYFILLGVTGLLSFILCKSKKKQKEEKHAK